MPRLPEHVRRLSGSLLNTELDGISLDLPLLHEYRQELRQSIEAITHDMRSLVEWECRLVELELYEDALSKRKTPRGKAGVKYPKFNFDSGAQLGKLLYEHLHLPEQRTRKGGYATDAKTLAKLADKHPLAAKITERNSLAIYLNNFVEGVLERQIGGRIYPSLNVSGTVTGRLSHSAPNLGNQPARTEWAKLRGMYLPDPGYVFCKADYSQLEVCLAAHYSLDKNLLKIIYEGASQHDITAEGVGIPRGQAKTLNFALQYGAGVWKVSQILDCSEQEAEVALAKYWETYSGLRKFIDWCHASVDQGRPLVSMFGRARHFKKMRRAAWDKAYKQSFNFFTQGTGGDCTNMAYYITDEYLRRTGLGYCVLSVHDEILIAARKDAWQEALNALEYIMVETGRAVGLRVPLSVEGEGGLERWRK